MKRHVFISALIMTLLVGTQFIGCGDDDKPTPSKPPADLNDPSYQAASFILDAANAGPESASYIAIINFWKIIGSGPNPPIYHIASGFWYEQDFQIDTVYSQENPSVIIETTQITIKDSVRFWHGGTAVRNPDSALLTRIESGLNIYATADSSKDTMTFKYDLNITGAAGEIWGDGVVAISGTGTMVGTASEGYYTEPGEPSLESLGVCKLIFDVATSYPNLVFDIDEMIFGCPITGGTATSTGPLNVVYCPGADENLEFPATWTASKTFAGENMTIVTNSPTRQWIEADTCDAVIIKDRPYPW